MAMVKSDETGGKVRLRRVAVKRGERRNGGGDKRQPKQCNAAKTDPLSGWASLSRDGASCCIYSGGLGTFGLFGGYGLLPPPLTFPSHVCLN